MNFTIENINKKKQNEFSFLLKNALDEELSCYALLDNQQHIKELLVLNETSWTYESIINFYSTPILCKIEDAIIH
jgi:hypothetical protein